MSDWRNNGRFARCKACGADGLKADRTPTGRRIMNKARKEGTEIVSTGEPHVCPSAGRVHPCDLCKEDVRLIHKSDGYHLLHGSAGDTPHKGNCPGPKGKGGYRPPVPPEWVPPIEGKQGSLDDEAPKGEGDAAEGQPQDLAGLVESLKKAAKPSEGEGKGEGEAQGMPDGVAVIAAVLAPKLDQMLKTKADKAEVQKLVEDAVLEALAEREAPRAITITIKEREDGPPLDLGLSHVQLPQLIKAIQRHKHVYLYGSPGGGKGFAVRQAAKALGRGVAYLSLSPATPEWRLTGYLDAHGVYRGTRWRDAVQNGAIFALDEVDNASAASLVALNETLANGWAAFPDGEIEVNAQFCVVAIGNTLGRGGVRGHETRQALDMATLDRFALIEWRYDNSLELALIKPTLGTSAEALLTWSNAARVAWKKVSPADPCPLTPRMLVRLAQALADGDEWDVAIAEAGGARFGEVAARLPEKPRVKFVTLPKGGTK